MTLSYELLAALAMLAGLVVYTLTGGADFGGGVWDLLAVGPRAKAQRRAIERALGPVWEANHVWLIFVIVVLFTAFPPAFARLGIDLHVPLTLMLVGIVLRGSAFVFRAYGDEAHAARWGRVFAISSAVTPIFLGMSLGAMTAGGDWWRPFPLAVGALAVVTFAFLAAVYLTLETEGALREDFRARALGAAAAIVVAAALPALLAEGGAARFGERLLGSWWSPLVVGGAGLALAGAVAALATRRWRLARAAAIAAVTLLVAGWGLAHHPLIFAPDLTLHAAAAPRTTLVVLAPLLVGGGVILIPCLWWLIRVFKSERAGTSLAAGGDDASSPPESR
jgi:cytochrome d ubiquinol oxidase subunit II